MNRATLLPVIIIFAFVIGGLLYLFGGSVFHQTYQNATTPGTFLSDSKPLVLGQGQDAISIDQRVNYRITDVDQFATLWRMVYGNTGEQVPEVDFTKYEVLALFDGSHATGGYGIELTSVQDARDTRTVTVTHSEPGDSCVPAGGITSPFLIVQVTKSSLPISRVEQSVTKECE